MGDGATGRLVGAAPARRLPWQAVATSEGDERGHEHKSFDGGRSRLAPPCGEGRVQVTRCLTRWRGAPGDSHHSSSTARPAEKLWRAVRERMGSPRCPSTFALPNRGHAFASGVSPKTRGEKSGSRFPRGCS